MKAASPGHIRGTYGTDPHAMEPRIQEIMDRVFVDADGLVIGAVKDSTLRPYTLADMKGVPLERTFGANAAVPHKYKLLIMNYEETGMAHGDYLMAMLEKYKATRDPSARRRARGAFSAIRRLADAVAKTNPYGRGWWPKPYGGMKDLNAMFETSIDQTVKIVLAITQYERELATASERAWCRMQVRAMADWWIQHHFTTVYFGNCCWWYLHRYAHSASGLLYLVRQGMACTPGRTPRHMAEAWEFLMKNAPRRLRGIGDGVNVANLTIECVRRLDDLDPAHRRLWRRCGAAMTKVSVDLTDAKTGTVLVGGYGRYNVGLRAACTAAEYDRWLRRRCHADFVWSMLTIYNRMEKFYHHDQTDKPRKRNAVNWWFDALSGHHYASWLLAYWRLRNTARPPVEG